MLTAWTLSIARTPLGVGIVFSQSNGVGWSHKVVFKRNLDAGNPTHVIKIWIASNNEQTSEEGKSFWILPAGAIEVTFIDITMGFQAP